ACENPADVEAGQNSAAADQTAAGPDSAAPDQAGQMPEGAATPEEALAGAQDIIAELAADEAVYRQHIRNLTFEMGMITSSLKSDKSAEDEKEEDAVFRMYYDFSEKVSTLPTHRILALNRGEAKKVLNVKIELPEKYPVTYLCGKLVQKDNPYTTPVLEAAAEDSYKRLIAPSIEREIRSALTEKAEDASLVVFADNLKQLLMAPPVAGQTVLGWDPGFAHGCKLAVVDPTGKVLDTAIVYVTRGKGSHDKDELMLDRMVRNNKVTLISIGNGTASRESEQYVADYLKKRHSSVKYTIVSEAGASIYSASKQAQKEFPDFTVEQRSAVSIARRIQDPLAELVKIDPKSIGVGQYQHDMNQKKLGQSLSGVVEDCVNRVGVDLNTASASLLEYVSGITPAVAANIVAYREENGRFMDRRQLMKVPKLGPKAFEQCAGFLRITGGKNPLDATAVHPESYEAVQKLARILGIRTADLTAEGFAGISKKVKDLKATADQVGVGTMTLTDILKELEKPARDPRQDSPAPILRSDVLAIEDLQEGMILKGTVRNVVDFGAFVDIGVHQDGLVHVSQLSNKFIKNPFDVVKVGDIVEVKVKSVDLKRHRIQLTMKGI
ncbi:MAG: helix-hairpin-helix domain-containing protein, partial [Lachnospiraceae bacterium]